MKLAVEIPTGAQPWFSNASAFDTLSLPPPDLPPFAADYPVSQRQQAQFRYGQMAVTSCVIHAPGPSQFPLLFAAAADNGATKFRKRPSGSDTLPSGSPSNSGRITCHHRSKVTRSGAAFVPGRCKLGITVTGPNPSLCAFLLCATHVGDA